MRQFKVSCHFGLSPQTIHRCYAVLNLGEELTSYNLRQILNTSRYILAERQKLLQFFQFSKKNSCVLLPLHENLISS